jgi:archaellum component FlaC
MCDCDKIMEELEKINNKLDNIQLDGIRKEESFKKLTTHIEFIENTYTNYRSSLEFIKNKVSWFSLSPSPKVKEVKLAEDLKKC